MMKVEYLLIIYAVFTETQKSLLEIGSGEPAREMKFFWPPNSAS